MNNSNITDPSTSTTTAGQPLSDVQEIILFLLVTISGILSVIGSWLILLIVRNSKRKKRGLSVYDRLLVGLSVADFMVSCGWILGAYLVPKDDRVWTFGNDATCNFFGFNGLTVFVSLLYSSMISLYYSLLVRYGFRDDQLAGKIEISIHLLCTLYPIVGHAVFLALDGYGPRRIGLNCYLSDYPKGCVYLPTDELEEGQVRCKNQLASVLISGLPGFVSISIILICNMMIFCHVRGSIRQYQKKAFARWENATGFFENPAQDPSGQTATATKQSSAKGSFLRMGRKKKQSSSQSLTREISNRDNQMQQVRAVMNQSLFYVGSMALVNIPMCVQVVVGGFPKYSRENESELFVFLCFTTFLSPLQGILNLFIFCRPTYLRIRRSCPNESRLTCFLRTLEAGTTDNRGGKRRRLASQLRPHPSPRKPMSSICNVLKSPIQKFWNYFWLTKGVDSKNEIEKHKSSDTEKGKRKSNSLEDPNENSLSLGQDDGDDVIQLEMQDLSSSSSSSSPSNANASRVNETMEEVQVAPDVDIDNEVVIDWRNIDFDSSCVALFNSTTSTVEA